MLLTLSFVCDRQDRNRSKSKQIRILFVLIIQSFPILFLALTPWAIICKVFSLVGTFKSRALVVSQNFPCEHPHSAMVSLSMSIRHWPPLDKFS